MPRGRPPYPGLLTPREQEVLDLLRQGLTNPQIAGRLGISLAGARYHVSEILSKLGVSSREEAAAWQPERAPALRRPVLRALAMLAVPFKKLAAASPLKMASAGAIGAAAAGMGLLAAGVLVMASRNEDAPVGAPPPTSEPQDLGRIAYVDGSDIWTRDLPDGTPQRLTVDGRSRAPQWSPTGQWLLFEKPVPRDAAEVWVMRSDGTDVRRLDARESASWASDRDVFAYRDASSRLWVEQADGSDRVELLRASEHGFDQQTWYFEWSPDGQWIAVTTETRGAQPYPADYVGLWAVRADGSEARELVAEHDVGYGLLVAGWTPDSEQVIYSPQPSLSASFSSGGMQWMTVELDHVDGPATSGVTPDSGIDNARRVLRYADYRDVSPSGQLIAVRGGGRDTYLNKSIARVETSAGLTFFDLTDPDEVAATSPVWSPDGSTIAYVAQPVDRGIDPASVIDRRIWLMDAGGSEQRRLTGSETWEERPQWSADGDYMLYVRPEVNDALAGWQAPARAELILRDLENEGEVAVGVVEYEVNSVEAGIWYYGHFAWSELFDWWQP